MPVVAGRTGGVAEALKHGETGILVPPGNIEALAQAFAVLKNPSDLKAFLQDLCTPAEMEALVDRWQVVPYVINEMPYREIHEHTGVSVTTIGRVARTLNTGAGGYQAAAKRLGITKTNH